MTRVQRICLASLVAAHLAFDLLLLPLLDEDKVDLAAMGVGTGQVVLLGLWLALADAPRAARAIYVGASACAMHIAVLAGLRLFGVFPPFTLDVVAIIAIEIALGTLVAAGIFGLLWRMARWHVDTADHETRPARAQFGLRQLLLTIGVACVWLGAARGLVGAPNVANEFEADAMLIIVGHTVMALLLLYNIATLLPVFWICLSERYWYGMALTVLIGALPIAGCLALVEAVVVGIFSGWSPSIDEMFYTFFTFHFAQLLVIGATLAALRASGFHLRRALPR